ncbi:hypothetical protein BJX76DRAFT_365950 [Aspergillus varians]
MQRSAEVIIIGSGVGGLAAAKTYLELSPQTDLVLLEKRPTLGGVWAEENCYEGLKTNNLLGTYEFTDFPMDTTTYGVREGEHIPGFVLHKYFNDFADHFDLRRRIRFNTTVLEVEKVDGGWKILVTETAQQQEETQVIYTCDKLIISSGLASNANPISIPGKEDFGRPVLNHSELRDRAAALAEDPNVKSVTVVGASKTGYDAVFLMAAHGKKVEWVIRESGGGAVWMAEPWVDLGGLKVRLEHMATMRFFSWFSPCTWGNADGFGWIRSALHRTRLGRFLVNQFWEKIRSDVIETNGYRREEALKHLEPDESLFWSARVGVLNYASDIHEYLRTGQVTITKRDISHLSAPGTVHFADETTLQTDALIAITGWNLAPTIKYKPDGLDAHLGLPSRTLTPEQESLWEKLDSMADTSIMTQFPTLAHPPKTTIPYKQSVTPFRLYRGISPPSLTSESDPSLACMKMVHSTSNMIIAETQALWIYAYMNGKLDIDREAVYRETALASRFGKHRYPCGFSAWYPEFVYDAIPYADLLLKDLGLKGWRKPSMLREVFEGYTIHDYRGLNREWRERAMGREVVVGKKVL